VKQALLHHRRFP